MYVVSIRCAVHEYFSALDAIFIDLQTLKKDTNARKPNIQACALEMSPTGSLDVDEYTAEIAV